MGEQKFQATVLRWLKAKGCYVIKAQAGPGVPVGCPDIIALLDGGGWLGLEVKASKTSKFQPLQVQTIKKLNDMYYSRAVYPEIWGEVKKELETML